MQTVSLPVIMNAWIGFSQKERNGFHEKYKRPVLNLVPTHNDNILIVKYTEICNWDEGNEGFFYDGSFLHL